jgi:hypothetical protein
MRGFKFKFHSVISQSKIFGCFLYSFCFSLVDTFDYCNAFYWMNQESVVTRVIINSVKHFLHFVSTLYSQTVFKNRSCYTVRPGNVSCLQKFQHFWMIIRDLFFESGSIEATKIKINTAKVCHLYFWSNNSALFEHWNWKSPFKHRWMVCFRSKKGVKNLFLNALIFPTTGAFNIVLHWTSLYA